MTSELQAFVVKAASFLGGLGLVLIGGVWVPNAPHADGLITMGLFMIAHVIGYSSGEMVTTMKMKANKE